jgi:hypothetical protein
MILMLCIFFYFMVHVLYMYLFLVFMNDFIYMFVLSLIEC